MSGTFALAMKSLLCVKDGESQKGENGNKTERISKFILHKKVHTF